MVKRKNNVTEKVETPIVEETVEKPTVIEEKIKDVKSDESPRFTLSQLVNSNRYKAYGYLLEAKLQKDEKYTLAEVDELISGLVKR